MSSTVLTTSIKKNKPEGDCAICCEKYNNSSHIKVICEFGDCNYETCKKCMRDYLLSTTQDPHCMTCKKKFSQAYIVNRLNSSFVMTEYKTHRKELLLEREISKLPETMPAAEKATRIKSEENRIKEIYVLRKNITDQLIAVRDEEYRCRLKIHRIKNNTDTDTNAAATADKTERKKFIMPCRLENCRGFLNTHYKCEICSQHTCSKCLELIGDESNKEAHECIQSNIESAELIRKDTKGCPSCGTRIFKISGCDQMWCSCCHKAWSWTTGKIDMGVVHNPHFYQFQRDNGGGTAPRNPGDVLCGGLTHIQTVRSEVIRKLDRLLQKIRKDELTEITEINIDLVSSLHIENVHRAVAHLVHVDLADLRHKMRVIVENNETFRVDYLLNNITKAELADSTMRNDINRQKNTEILNIYELISVVGTELFADLVSAELNKETVDFIIYTERKMSEYDNLRLYCNKQLAKVSVTFSQSVPQLDCRWQKRAVKFTRKELLEIDPIDPVVDEEKVSGDGDGDGKIVTAPIKKIKLRIKKPESKEAPKAAVDDVIVID